MTSRIRIISGLVLFLFVFGHLLNLAVGLVSLEAMDNARPILMGLWSNPIGGSFLLLAFVTHAVLGLLSIYQRNALFVNLKDTSQALLGLAILPLLLPHVMGTAVGPALTNAQPTFAWVLAVYWLFAPGLGMQQVFALVVVWTHGCYGLFLWLGVQNWWVRVAPFAYPIVVAVPTAALLGFVSAGKFIHHNRENPEIMSPVLEVAKAYDTVAEQLWALHDQILLGYFILVGVVLVARWFRLRAHEGTVEIAYDQAPSFRHDVGQTLLEMAASENVVHASLCGGRGRCGSCAVHVLDGSDQLSKIESQEAEVLAKTHLCDHVGGVVRLACQALPQGGSLKVERVYDPRILPIEYKTLLRKQSEPTPDTEPDIDPDPTDVIEAQA